MAPAYGSEPKKRAAVGRCPAIGGDVLVGGVC